MLERWWHAVLPLSGASSSAVPSSPWTALLLLLSSVSAVLTYGAAVLPAVKGPCAPTEEDDEEEWGCVSAAVTAAAAAGDVMFVTFVCRGVRGASPSTTPASEWDAVATEDDEVLACRISKLAHTQTSSHDQLLKDLCGLCSVRVRQRGKKARFKKKGNEKKWNNEGAEASREEAQD